MNWQDEGFLLSKKKFRENANIINVFTNNFGKVSGIVYGGNSRKIRNFLQVSNKILVFYNAKNENRIGYFKTELLEPVSPKYFNDKKRTAALLSITGILNLLLPESQPNQKIYNSLINLIKNIDRDDWFYLYVFWELNLIRELGFDPNLKKTEAPVKDKLIDYKIDGVIYKIPFFFFFYLIPEEVDSNLIRNSLSFTRSIINNKFFLPNNLVFPKSRIILENYFN